MVSRHNNNIYSVVKLFWIKLTVSWFLHNLFWLGRLLPYKPIIKLWHNNAFNYVYNLKGRCCMVLDDMMQWNFTIQCETGIDNGYTRRWSGGCWKDLITPFALLRLRSHRTGLHNDKARQRKPNNCVISTSSYTTIS